MKKTPVLAILGTGSDVGKSIVTTALCRIFHLKGISVAPFKAQNMSNNSGVTPDGLEMGRAQIVQAEAAGVAPHVDMNPILLKPTGEMGSQVVLLGKVSGNQSAVQYYEKKRDLLQTVSSSLERLKSAHDLVIIEGAGSCAEVNLMRHDIVNFKMAEISDAPVILVGDIHRGGIFAQLTGTLFCLPKKRRDRIRGLLINRFRGDLSLFREGVTFLERKTKKPVIGVLPHLSDLGIEQEDSVAIEKNPPISEDIGDMEGIAIIRLPHIANFNDFDPLKRTLTNAVHYLERPQCLKAFRAVILPGSKNTRHDLVWLNTSGWREELLDFYKNGGHILGICGGYQMMGERINDPHGLEDSPGESKGLGILSAETTLKSPKITTRTQFSFEGETGAGYEIHMGETLSTKNRFMVRILSRNGKKENGVDGAVSLCGRAMGTYIHGFFDHAPILGRWLTRIGISVKDLILKSASEEKENRYNRLAEHVSQFINMDLINELINEQTEQ